MRQPPDDAEVRTQFAMTLQGDLALFGTLHRVHSSMPASMLGVVICPPFGYEAICSHRAVRAFAQRFAERGMPTLRFDYHGTGDSVGDDLQPRRVEAWLASIAMAVQHVRQSTGVEQVALVGIRLGALLAMTFGSRRSDIAAVVAVAPAVSGRVYVRELKILQSALQLAPNPLVVRNADTEDKRSDGRNRASADREAIGFALTEETVISLSTMDAVELPQIAPALLIVDRIDLGNTKGLSESQQRIGVQVSRQTVDGYVDMMLDPHKTKTPMAMLEVMCDWLQSLAPSKVSLPAVNGNDMNLVSLMDAESCYQQGHCIIDSRTPLLAIETKPQTGSGEHVVLMLNAGSVRQIGPNRLYVRLARQLAARGVASMRLDFSGIGDSSAQLPRDENTVYMDNAVADVRAAVRTLRQRYQRVSVLGLCSGAYHAFKTAVAGERFEHVVMINPLVFFWRAGMSLDNVESHVVADAQQYAASLKSVDKWKKLLRGEVNIRHVLAVIAERALQRAKFQTRDIARQFGFKVGDEDLGFDIQQVAQRGDKLHWIFADSDPGRELLVEKGGSTVEKMRASGQLTVDVINGADHTFTAMWTHSVLLSCILKRLEIQQ